MKRILFTFAGLLIISLTYGQGDVEKLEKVLNRLDEIKTASYYTKSSSSAPGDTLAFNTYERFVNMYVDSTDKFLGAKFSMSEIDNHHEFDLCYDGHFAVQFDWLNKNVQIDTLTDNPRGRPMAPFFIQVKSLIKYTLDNLDDTSVVLNFHEFEDSILIKFAYKNKLIEFIGLDPFVHDSKGKISRYDLVLDKEYLPYKFVRRMPHQTSWQTCTDIQISRYIDFEFNSLQQIPVQFKIKGKEMTVQKSYELEGIKAPYWKLKEINGDSISLVDLKNKVILIQFTGIGCGPCHTSIPFLRKLKDDYKDKDFELVCIESWSNNIAGIERYKSNNDINYRVLVSKNETTSKYKVHGVPVFFILDEERVIRNVVVGYEKVTTDEEIRRIIAAML